MRGGEGRKGEQARNQHTALWEEAVAYTSSALSVLLSRASLFTSLGPSSLSLPLTLPTSVPTTTTCPSSHVSRCP